ncbi:MAG: hypothetical protein Q9227_000851 [Pyrenula ochraceoflavens]
MLSDQTIETIKSTVPALRAHGEQVTRLFYHNLLTDQPELNSVFNQGNQANGHQAQALAAAVYAYAQNIETPDALAPAIRHITQKHASLFIRPGQYDVVGRYLLDAFGEVLGEAWTSQVREAWAEAYGELAGKMIEAEAELYREGAGWTDWRDFVVEEKLKESSEITSFILRPADGRCPLPVYLPGQYISVRVFIPSLNYSQPRQYSLSDSYAADHYRISVKKEAGVSLNDVAHPGIVSNALHELDVGETVQLSRPYGDFVLDIQKDFSGPLVLISAGVGVTPLMSMLNTVIVSNPGRPIAWIHGYHDAQTRAFADHISKIARKSNAVHVTRFCSNPEEQERPGVDYERAGRVDLDDCDGEKDLFLGNGSPRYYVCGPTSFMSKMQRQLEERGIRPDRIFVERFGTGSL